MERLRQSGAQIGQFVRNEVETIVSPTTRLQTLLEEILGDREFVKRTLYLGQGNPSEVEISRDSEQLEIMWRVPNKTTRDRIFELTLTPEGPPIETYPAISPGYISPLTEKMLFSGPRPAKPRHLIKAIRIAKRL